MPVVQQPHGDDQREGPGLAWIAILVMRTCAFSVMSFLHRGMGRRWGDLEILLLVPLVFVYCILWQHEPYPLSPMGWFLVAVFVRRMVCRFLRLFGPRRIRGMHSQYDGTPYLVKILPWFSEWTIKRSIEPLLVAMAGLVVLGMSPPLGSYLLLSAGCMKTLTFFAEVSLRNQVDAVHDGLVAQRMVADRLNDLHDDLF